MSGVAAWPLLLAAVLWSVGQPAPPGAAEHAGSCATGECHAAYREAAHPHLPVAMGVCKFCHRPASEVAHEFTLARAGGELCSPCHREIDPGASVHGDLGEDGCTLCHDPHGGEHPLLLSAPVADSCEACHSDILGERSVLHTPVATEPCTACHDPHDAGSARPAAGPADRCFRCHEATRSDLATKTRVHDPLATGDCGACHDPHGSESAAGLRQDVPALCFGCHEEIRTAVETTEHPHPVAGESGGCLVCHDPHASSLGAGLRDDPYALCGGCHADEISTHAGTLPAVVREIEASRFLHGPVRQRDCSACHNPHGSDHYRLLVENYSAEFYAPFDAEHYQLCFSCHPERKVHTERTTALTGFRNGDLNLHYLHVSQPAQGRTCRACHATHASDNPKHVREWVMFGQWKLPVEFVETETGGSCRSGCHEWRSYDREAPVEYGDLDPSTGTTKGAQ